MTMRSAVYGAFLWAASSGLAWAMPVAPLSALPHGDVMQVQLRCGPYGCVDARRVERRRAMRRYDNRGYRGYGQQRQGRALGYGQGGYGQGGSYGQGGGYGRGYGGQGGPSAVPSSPNANGGNQN